ncbi:MAG: TldD/PmbA family protein [Clostridia bacterium]|nr:TldD/PmbA family protein [Clostridia bacterium]
MKKQVKQSEYIISKKPIAEKILNALSAKYDYASVLLTDCVGFRYGVSKSGTVISQNTSLGSKGMVIKVYHGKSYAEYSTNKIEEGMIPAIEDVIDKKLIPFVGKLPKSLHYNEYGKISDTPSELSKFGEYEIDPQELGDEKIIAKLSDLRQKTLSLDKRLLDVINMYNYQVYHKVFLSKNRRMEQSAIWGESYTLAMAMKEDGEVKENFQSYSLLGGAEILDGMEKDIENVCKNTIELLSAEHIEPGVYDCICTPEVTGMIVHEAFGHGVEMDMFVKDRALAKEYIGKPVASELITMRDGNSLCDVATYFFDDEGTISNDTVVIDKGILKAGISDAQSAMFLGTIPTGNGRRESYERKAYTRMTNTYFEAGKDKLSDMIASIKYGMLLERPSSGMEDPKNWGIQCMVSSAREIKDGKFTGKIFSPIVLTGYVPDLLKSISMVSDSVEHCGSGACGKGYKEWVKVSDGGPYIKAKICLG